MLPPSGFIFDSVVDVQADANSGTTDADGSTGPLWQTAQAAVPCRIMADASSRRWNKRLTGMAEVVEGDMIVAFGVQVTLTAAANRLLFRDAAEGDRAFEILRLINVHQQGILWVAHCREYPG